MTPKTSWNDVISPNGEFPPEKGRYLLYAGLFCPFASRALIMRDLKGLQECVDVCIVWGRRGPVDEKTGKPAGWQFVPSDKEPRCSADPMFNCKDLSGIYFHDEPEYKGRYTVPVLFDKKTKRIVNNESLEVMRMFSTCFDPVLLPDRQGWTYYPKEHAKEIDRLSTKMSDEINSIVYEIGLADDQSDYDKKMDTLFKALDFFDDMLDASDGPFLFAYFTLFKCNDRMIRSGFKHLNTYMKRLFSIPAFEHYTDFHHIKDNYFTSFQKPCNPSGVVPRGPLPHIEPLTSSEETDLDSRGQYNFFLLSILLLGLIPWTIYTINHARKGASRLAVPCSGWNKKDESVTKSRSSRPKFRKNQVGLAIGWAFLAFFTWRAASIKLEGTIYDPFAILGLSSSSNEKAIKKHYKRLTLKFHPDKLKLSENQTKEDADAHFVELTKAYKALTDETIRRNYELYGHPDGKQDFAMGIAIPKSFIAAQNNAYVLGLYALLFGVALPYFVGRWWFASRKYTKDNILNMSAATLYINMKEDMNFAKVVEIVAASTEIENALRKSTSLKSSEFDRLQNQVKEQIKNLTGEKMDGLLYKQKYCQRAGVLIYAHLLRIQINDTALLKDKQEVITLAYRVTAAFGNIVLAHSWLSAYNTVLALQQALAQALHPSLPRILQLPHLTPSMIKEAPSQTVENFVQASDAERKQMMLDMDERQQKEAINVAEHWPRLELVHAAFKVIGERIVTPGAIVQLIVKVKIVPPKRAPLPQPNGILAPPTLPQEGGSGAVTPLEHVRAEEQDLDSLIGRKADGSDGEEPNSYAHTPRLPFDKVPSWYMYVGDQKLDRIFIQPSKFTDIGSTQVRTLRLTHPAPQGPGLYTFQVFIKSDCYLGTDIKKNMQMLVEPVEALEAAERQPQEDEISDPEEDSIAGQMAAMRGQKVKRIQEEEDDDTSGTDDDYDDDEGGNTTSEDES